MDKTVIRQSWGLVTSSEAYKEQTLGVDFMVKVFKNNPSIQHLWKFAADLKTESEIRACPQVKNHGNRIIKSVNLVVEKLDDQPALEKTLVDLGARHIKYNAKVEHIPLIGAALIETLKDGLGDAYDKEVATAWSHVLSLIAVNIAKGLEKQ